MRSSSEQVAYRPEFGLLSIVRQLGRHVEVSIALATSGDRYVEVSLLGKESAELSGARVLKPRSETNRQVELTVYPRAVTRAANRHTRCIQSDARRDR